MATTTDVPGLFDVAINGRAYKARAEHHRRRLHDLLRRQADSGEEPSERSLNPEDLWRRGQTNFYLGEGQDWFDNDLSDRHRYGTSAHLDPWDEHTLKLLKSTSEVTASGDGPNIGKAVLCNGEVFAINGTHVSHWDGNTWTDSADLVNPIVDIATDGTTVYLASRDSGKTTGGIYVINTATTSAPYTPVLLNSVIPDLVDYVSGRLMVAAGYSLYNITDVGSTTPPDAFTAAAINSEWEWDCFAWSPQYIYVAGHAGDRALVYRVTVREDGTALTAPVVATQLPEGEQVVAMAYYQGVMLLGTTRGLRVAAVQGGGLPFGALAEIGEIDSLEPQGRFVWCGMTDGTIVRVDLSRFVPNFDLLPAYAHDLDSGAGAAKPVVSILTYGDRRLFVIAGDGVYYEDASSYETEGTYTSGKITYGLIDPKQFVFVDVRAEDLTGASTVDVELSIDGGSWVTLGALDAGSPEQTFTVTDVVANPVGENAELRLTLNGPGNATPIVTRWTLRAKPAPSRTEEVQVVLDLFETVLAYSDEERHLDVWGEFEALRTLATSGTIVDYQEHSKSYKASVENVQLGPELKVAGDRLAWEGPCLVTLKVYA